MATSRPTRDEPAAEEIPMVRAASPIPGIPLRLEAIEAFRQEREACFGAEMRGTIRYLEPASLAIPLRGEVPPAALERIRPFLPTKPGA